MDLKTRPITSLELYIFIPSAFLALFEAFFGEKKGHLPNIILLVLCTCLNEANLSAVSVLIGGTTNDLPVEKDTDSVRILSLTCLSQSEE